ncbi:unnamed protein product [Larinioides sclopetarius]|uniref:Uncharacterized protein n=1 Tax=Larinioides sclopetarius TaxID=280406 RepID=A0AAV2BRT2_9ARAC
MLQEMSSVIKYFYPYFWRKFKFFDEDEIETECEGLIKNLRKAVWVHRIVSFWQWRYFFDSHKNADPITSSRDQYVSQIYFMVSSAIKDLPNIHESFLTTCSLVTAVAAYFTINGCKKFLKYCPDILVVLFEENYSKESDRAQIWDHFLTYNYSDAYEIVEKKTNGNPFSDVVNELDFVIEIQEKIKSTISVRKFPAVYRYTTEVVKRYKIRKYSFEKSVIISKEEASTQTEESLQNTEESLQNTEESLQNTEESLQNTEESLQNTEKSLQNTEKSLQNTEKSLQNTEKFLQNTEKFLQNTEERRQSECGQILLMRLIEFVNPNQSLQAIEEQIKPESGQRFLMQLSEFIDLKIAQSNSKEQLLQKEEKQEISPQTQSSFPKIRKHILENEQSSTISKITEDVSSEEISSFQSELSLEDTRKPQIVENDQSSSKMEETKAANLTISSFCPEEHSIHIAEKSRISNVESTSVAQGIEMTSKHDSAIQMKRSFQEDLKQPRISESEQSLSVTEETRDIYSMPISSLESQEQPLQNNIKELKTSDDEQRIPVIVSYNNLNSEDNTSQFETENPTEKNYSDTLHDSESTNQNTAPQSQQNSKKKKRKQKRKKNNSQTFEIKQSSTKVEDEAVDLRISSYSEEKSLQNEEQPRDSEESLPVLSKKEVSHALVFLKQNLIYSFGDVCDSFNLPVHI